MQASVASFPSLFQNPRRRRVLCHPSSPHAHTVMASSVVLRLRHHNRSLSTSHSLLFSSSSSSSSSSPIVDENEKVKDSGEEREKISSYFSDVKARLRQNPLPPRPPLSSPRSPHLSPPKPSQSASFEELRKNLSEFRRRSGSPIPTGQDNNVSSSSPPPISFQDLYKNNVISNSNSPADSSPADAKSSKFSFDSIRESLRQIRSNPASVSNRPKGADHLKLFRDSLNLKPSQDGSTGSSVLGGAESVLPSSIFGRELRDKRDGESPASRTEFLKMYTYDELGAKLKKLRPAEAASGKKKDWFSLEELNDRLRKLREIEEKETSSRVGGLSFKDLRDCLEKLERSSNENMKKSSMQRLALLGQIGGQVTPSFMLSPPKEHLVDKYSHPDNMSSAEKMKLELAKVRDEFKMSESDCGSSRVQIAQLTTKIKHLSSSLHKKDKHSRKGLIAMVQRRKKLLKYLRRTDWDSYCYVLSKLGLRDNPDYKN